MTATLPGLLRGLGMVDIFIQGSLHTYEHMKFEFELSRPHIKHDGLLFAGGALWNPAFTESSLATASPAVAIIRIVGVLKT